MCIVMCTSYPFNLSVLPYYGGGGPTSTHVSSGGTGRIRIGEQETRLIGLINISDVMMCVYDALLTSDHSCIYRTRSRGEHDAAGLRGNIRTLATCDLPQITQASPSQRHRSACQPKSLMRSLSTSQNQKTPRNFPLLTSRRSSLNGSVLMSFAFAATSKSRIGW